MYTISCRGAGIGIQDSLKNYCPHGLKGSSPFPGITLENHLQGWFFIGKKYSPKIEEEFLLSK